MKIMKYHIYSISNNEKTIMVQFLKMFTVNKTQNHQLNELISETYKHIVYMFLLIWISWIELNQQQTLSEHLTIGHVYTRKHLNTSQMEIPTLPEPVFLKHYIYISLFNKTPHVDTDHNTSLSLCSRRVTLIQHIGQVS